jgi:NADH-quinone oxidoreductase subunit F
MKRIENQNDLEKLRERLIQVRETKKPTIVISSGTCGQARGSAKVVKAFEDGIKKLNLEDKVNLRVTGCHGFCEIEPVVLINPQAIVYQKVKPEDAESILSQTIVDKKIIEKLLYVDPQTGERITHQADIPFYKKQQPLVMGNNIQIDPTKIEDYLAVGGYKAIGKALTKLTPEKVIDEVKRAGLRGRGGAGFPTGFKWDFCRKAKGEVKYIICNADEGDPGAYMDRSLLEGNPHSVLEGMIIGAYAIGANQGFIYVRNEYPLAVKNTEIAIQQARGYGLLGKNILGSGFDFDIKINRGAGAFVCGEETALMASIMGRLGEPWQRPPFPVQKGLWGKPTNINNVETWANVPLIISRGADWYSSIGTKTSKGTKIFSLVGKINNTGLVEVPMGISLSEIIEEIGGGIPRGRKFKAVQTGGPSGGCMPQKLLDLPIDYEGLTQAGSIMGSGGMIVMDDHTCMVDVAKYFLNFLQDESCGKCFTCRKGIQRLLEIVSDISEGRGKEGDIELLEELAHVVQDTTLCGLGQTAPNPLLSTIRYFRDEYEAHIRYKRCPAAVCSKIISSPCKHTCPIDTDVPAYVALIAKGQYGEALEVVREENPLPGVCSRVCHHPCESKCRAGDMGDPISIRALKRFVVDYGMENGKKPSVESVKKKEQKVAIVGSGPAGLSAGYSLVQKGYEVTIFESLPVVGGMLAVAIPEHRLPRKILKWDIENIKNAGVNIKTNHTLGQDFSLDDLFQQGYKAIFLALGAHKSFKLGISGEDSDGVLDSMEFLKSVNLGKEIKIGKRVGIIGGGNAAIDAARVARRMKGCEKVTIIYRRTKKEMPAFKEEIDSAIEEGIDIQFLTAPTKILAEKGKVKGIECVRMKLGEVDESGRRRPIPIAGSEFITDLDTLIPAIGEFPDLFFLRKKSEIEVTKRGTLVVDPETLVTSREGVFAGGDVVTGPATVVEAIAHGKLAAEFIEKYLKGEPLRREYQVTKPSLYVEPIELTEEEIAEADKRAKMPRLHPEERVTNFEEVELGLKEEKAKKEARRCLRCDLEETLEEDKKEEKPSVNVA